MIEIGKALFAHRGETVNITNSKIGETGIGGAKVSAIGTLFDLLFMTPGSVAVYESAVEDVIYCEINGLMATCSETLINKEPSQHWDKKHLLIPHVIYELSRYGNNQALKDKFEFLCEEWATKGAIMKTDLAEFCDIYYREIVPLAIEREEMLTSSQVEASFRSEAFYQSDIFKKNCGKVLTKSSFDETAAKKAVKRAAKKSEFLQECKEGKYRIPYHWPKEQQTYVQDISFLDKFESIPSFESLVKLVHYCALQCIERMDYGAEGVARLQVMQLMRCFWANREPENQLSYTRYPQQPGFRYIRLHSVKTRTRIRLRVKPRLLMAAHSS